MLVPRSIEVLLLYVHPKVKPIEKPEPYLEALRNSPEYDDIGMNPFRALREAFELTQVLAADHVGVSRSLWLAWERKERPITALQLGQVAACFDLERKDVSWILKWWSDSRAAEITVAQMNALMDRVGVELVDPVEILFALWNRDP